MGRCGGCQRIRGGRHGSCRRARGRGSSIATLVETASLYELIHAAVLLWLCDAPGRYARAARWLFLIGTLLFCGTLYLKALMGWEAVVRLAPIGGVSFMLGWLLIALGAWTSRGRTDIRS
jgi:uncharacterized membrane protein YgdD (TMEM256/DUF423 family)